MGIQIRKKVPERTLFYCQESRGFVKFRVESVEFRVSLQFTVESLELRVESLESVYKV